jgi:trehalose-6-phosphate synthase
VAAAISRAMAMSRSERKARHAELYAALLRNDISKWGDKFLRALNPPDKKSAGSVQDYLGPPVREQAAIDPMRPPATRQ